jgi:hypothetical protein
VNERPRLLAALALAIAVRVPFWLEAARTPLDGDAAIVGLMARHPFASASFWGQPYGSPLDAWLAAPFVRVLGTTTLAVRLPAFLAGLALVPLAWALGRSLDARAARPAAILAACPSSYMLLMSAMPPPLYAAALLLAGALLLLAALLGDAVERGVAAPLRLSAWGALAGLALWTHLMTAGVVLAGIAWFLRRARGRRVRLLPMLVALTACAAPWWWRARGDPAATHAMGLRTSPAAVIGHAAEVVPRLHETLGGLLGAWTPWVADIAGPVAATPAWAAVPLILLQGLLLGAACLALRKGRSAWMLLAAILLTLAAFPLSRRAGANDLRFLTPLYLPAVALMGWTLARVLDARGACVAAVLMAALGSTGGARLLGAWHGADRAAAPFHLPDLAPVRSLLAAHGISRAYASYGPAYRLTYESGERLVVSQFRNERFPDQPLPYLDEVRFADRVAWVLTPQIPSDMPAPEAFENDLRVAGGSWVRDTAGPAVVFHGFVPPFGPEVVPLASAGRAGDGDFDTGVTETGRGGVRFDVAPPQRLDAVTLVSPGTGPPLPPAFDVEASADGEAFDVVARRRPRRDRLDLVWEGAQPRYAFDSRLLAVPLDGREVAALRIAPAGVGGGPWALAEVLLHPSSPGARAAWADGSAADAPWSARREALSASPQHGRAEWYVRMLVASRGR